MKVEIRQTANGGWFAYNLTTKEDTGHYIRKTCRGAISHAKRLWGGEIEIVRVYNKQRDEAATDNAEREQYARLNGRYR